MHHGEVDADRRLELEELSATADRLDSMADTAELMGDLGGELRFRHAANRRRQEAMALLDE